MKQVDHTVTLSDEVDSSTTPLLLRRSDGAESGNGTTVPDDGTPMPLENGIEVTFSRGWT